MFIVVSIAIVKSNKKSIGRDNTYSLECTKIPFPLISLLSIVYWSIDRRIDVYFHFLTLF